jgi:HSP20 family molecular chaperone IbpA
MKGSRALKSKKTHQAAGPQIVVRNRLADLSESIYQTIAHRAYEFYEARGCEHGHDLEDWLRAETELQSRVNVNVTESAGLAIVHFELAGFAAGETKVVIEPRRIILWGKKEHPDQQESEETSHAAILRVVDLPYEIDSAKAAVTLKDGGFDVTLRRVSSGRSN